MLRALAVLLSAVLLDACGNSKPGKPEAIVSNPPPATRHTGEREERIIAELNEMRSNPAVYAAKINERRRYYRGNVLRLPGNVPIRTQEGLAALDEAVRSLR